jgi:glycosyltransferase involved in cell wall biosynthesis
LTPHVAYVVDSPTYGGAERCVVQLVAGLPELRRTVLATDPMPPRFAAAVVAAGGRGRTLPPVRGRARGSSRVAAAVLGADLVHVNLIDPATCADALVGAVSSGVPTIADVHMTGPVDPRLAPAYQACTAVLARSRPVAAALAGAYGIEPVVVRNGVPPPVPAPPRPAGPVRIRGVGRLTAQKGFDLLIGATRRLRAAGHAVDVAVAGEGRDAAALAAQDDVRFVGFVDDVPGFLAGADLFCLPSRAEALPLALLEAVAAGLPCVAADVGDISAELGDLVELVPPGEVDALTAALARLVAEPGRRAALGARAAAGAGRFDERATIAAVRDVYAAVLGSRVG